MKKRCLWLNSITHTQVGLTKMNTNELLLSSFNKAWQTDMLYVSFQNTSNKMSQKSQHVPSAEKQHWQNCQQSGFGTAWLWQTVQNIWGDFHLTESVFSVYCHIFIPQFCAWKMLLKLNSLPFFLFTSCKNVLRMFHNLYFVTRLNYSRLDWTNNLIPYQCHFRVVPCSNWTTPYKVSDHIFSSIVLCQ